MRERVSSRRLGRPLRVVVLDDHDGSRRMLCFTLASRGHLAIPTVHHEETLHVLRDTRADAVVYDWNARGRPLHGLGRTLRAVPTVRAVVVMSTREEPPGFCTEEAVDAYFTKPCVMSDLVAQLETLARTRPAR